MKAIKILSFIILIWLAFIILVFPNATITAGWINQTIQIVGEIITIPAMICALAFLVYGIIKIVKKMNNKDYLIICIVNFLSIALVIIGFIFIE